MAFMPKPVLYGQEIPEMLRGELTPDVTWRIENDTLYISGKGNAYFKFDAAIALIKNVCPWYEYRNRIHSVVIEDGITGVGDNLFHKHLNITSVTISESVQKISNVVFYGCKKLSVVEVKRCVPPSIDANTFVGLKKKKVKLIVPSETKTAYEANIFGRKFGTIEESDRPATVPCHTYTVEEGKEDVKQIQQRESGQFTLIVGKPIEIVKIDGIDQSVDGGKSVNLIAGHHKITYNRTINTRSGSMIYSRKELNQEIEFEFLADKTYIIDAPAEVGIVVKTEDLEVTIKEK